MKQNNPKPPRRTVTKSVKPVTPPITGKSSAAPRPSSAATKAPASKPAAPAPGKTAAPKRAVQPPEALKIEITEKDALSLSHGTVQRMNETNGLRYLVSSYTITSANDAPERDPANWALLGSNDGGATWATLDTQINQVFTGRYETRAFPIATPAAYNLYRLRIDSVADPSTAIAVQLAEIQLLETQKYAYWWSFGDGTTATRTASPTERPGGGLAHRRFGHAHYLRRLGRVHEAIGERRPGELLTNDATNLIKECRANLWARESAEEHAVHHTRHGVVELRQLHQRKSLRRSLPWVMAGATTRTHAATLGECPWGR